MTDAETRPPDPAPDETESAPSDRDMRRRLIEELDRLIERVQAMTPDYVPPAFSPRRLIGLIEKNLDRFSPAMRLGILKRLRSAINEDLLDIDTWKGIWYMVNYSLEYQGDILKRRITGEYETDPWGLDWEFMEQVRPFLTFLYQTYWRVQTTGLEHVPDSGRVLLIGNHHGRSPWEGAMVSTAISNEHSSGRVVRSLYAAWFATLPFLSMLFVKLGHAVGTVENTRRLLEADELVAVYPESYRRSGLISRRPISDAAAWPDFIKLALSTQTPIIPVAIVGAEETYAALGQATIFSRLTGRPHPLFSPQAPAFGPLGFMPLPSGWSIGFGEPIPTEPSGPEAADDEAFVTQLTGQIRDTIRAMLTNRGAERRSGLFRC